MIARRRARKSEEGSILVEFALSVFLMVTVFAGVFQFGYTFYAYNTLVNSVREGSRYASLKPYDSATGTPSTAFQTAVQNFVVYGDPNGGTVPVVRGLSTSNVNLSIAMSGAAPVSVTVSITGFSLDAVFQTVTLSGKPSCTFPYLGIPTPP